MEEHSLTNEQILAFSTALFQAERSQATMEKYLRSVRAFFLYQKDRPVTKDNVMAWKRYLQREENYSPSTVNASLAALNYLFNFLGWTDCRTHYLKIQRRLFRETGRELDRADYEKLSPLRSAWAGSGSPSSWKLSVPRASGWARCGTYRIVPTDYRLSIDRRCLCFKRTYALRTECERYNSRFKAPGQERLRVRNGASAANLNTLAHISALAVALAAVLHDSHSYRSAKQLRRSA